MLSLYSRTTQTFRLLILLLCIICLNPGRIFSQSCSCEVSDAKEQEYNVLLNLTDEQKEDSEAVHLPWGVPDSSDIQILYQQEYVIGYDGELRIPIWVAYRLTREDLNVNRTRKNCFRSDPRLPDDQSAACADYDEPVFDQGHMAPNADMLRTEAAMINTYIFSNIAPQHDKFNRGIWAYLESYFRKLTKKRGELYVVMGAVFDKDGDGNRDPNSDADLVNPTDRVAIPTHFYKILLFERSNGFIETMTFLLPHEDSSPTGTVKKDNFLRSHLSTIDAIEALTGIDYFKDLPENKETAVERFQATELWSSVEN